MGDFFTTGLLKSIDNGVSKSDYAYNNRNLLTSETQTLASRPARVVSYDYDDDGLRTDLVYPSTRAVEYAWTSRAQLQSVSADGPPPIATYTYDTADQVTGADYGNNQEDSYAYDPMGNRTTAIIASQGGSTTTYNANNANQYISVSGLTPISHDANGNLLLQNNVTYGWDSENRLLSVTPNTPALGDKSLVHSYDGQHRRVTRTTREWTAGGWSATETTHFIYDGWNVIEEYQLNTSNSVLVRNLTWGQDLGGSTSLQAAGGVGGLIMVEEINGSTTTAYHFHYDGNGNVTEVTDLNGNSAASYRYDAFGNTLVSTGSYALQNRYRFSTKPLDREVTNAPLYYYGYRYYDPVTGRWPSMDPIGERGGVNLYGFVGNDGVNRLDLLGLLTYEEAIIAGSDDARRKTAASVDPKIGEISGTEFCELICKCGDDFQATPAHSGFKPTLKKFTIMEEINGRFVFKEIWRRTDSATCDPTMDADGNRISCAQFGAKWKMVAAYHSHPTNSGWSPSDDGFLDLGYGFVKVTPDGRIELLTEGGKVIVLRP